MIKEDFVSFEVAQLLKEKGLNMPLNSKDWICCMYDENGNIHWGMYAENWYFRITHQVAMKWLREVHNINIEIRCYKNIVEAFIMTIEDLPKCLVRGISSNKYEETVEAALKHCLKNLI